MLTPIPLGARRAFIASALALAAIFTAQPAHAGFFEYSADDGSGSINTGPGFAGQMLWGNYFFAQPGADVITTISVAFGNIAADRPVTLLLFDDPDNDGNPANASVIAQTAGLTALPQSNTFIDYAINPTQVSGGFFVAALMDVVPGENPGRRDPQTITAHSWIAANPGTIDLGNISASVVYFNMQDYPIPGNWMVRATAIPAPATMAITGLLAICGTRRRR